MGAAKWCTALIGNIEQMAEVRVGIFTVRYAGGSSVGRANVWNITCDCDKKGFFSPPTTLFATQQVTCRKCGKSETIDYNYVLDVLDKIEKEDKK